MDFQEEVLEAKNRFKKRVLIDAIHPYREHIELFLACISPEYGEETQTKLVEYQLACTKPEDFIVPSSKVNFHWQTTDDSGDTIEGEKVLNDYAARSIYGPLNEVFKQVFLLNNRACAVHVAINQLEGSRRTNDNVTGCRAVWVEDDTKQSRGPRPPSDFPLPYSFVVESSDKKYHYYWLTFTRDLRMWERIQKEVMTSKYGSDRGANGLNRAMRCPGFWHKKTKKFATRIVYMVDHEFTKIEPSPSDDFYKLAVPNGGKIEYAFTCNLASEVKRYDWEEIVNSFGQQLSSTDALDSETSGMMLEVFNPIEAMSRVFEGDDYHSSLHSLCMHFANFVQDTTYVTDIVQSLMCRTPEADRSRRWQARFNDVKRSARAAVNRKIEEIAASTLDVPKINGTAIKDVDLHSADWIIDFPDITGACKPLDLLLSDFERILIDPIRSFNFAAIISLFALISQNIPVMPVLKTRKANGCHLLLARSAGGKDINVSGPLRALAHALLQGGYISPTDLRSNEIVYSLLSGNAEITSLSAFHKWAGGGHNSSGAIWRNTECTSIIAKMTDENTSVANLSETVISIQDGLPIPPVTKATGSKDKKEADAPLIESYSLLFATQPASIKRYMNPRLLYKGVIGRFDYYVPDKEESNKIVSFLDAEVTNDYIFSIETLDFLRYALNMCSHHVTHTSTDPKDEISRNCIIQYDKDWTDPAINGPNRQKHVDWDKAKRTEMYSDDIEFRTFIDRVAMSTERYLTTLTFMQHLYNHYKAGTDPFEEQPACTPELIDCAIKLGDYQYEVRQHRIWSLIAREKGLDDKHQAMLDAIKTADAKPDRWINIVRGTPYERAYIHLYEKERFIPVSGILRYLAKDAGILTKDGINICLALADFGYLEFVKMKQIDLRISNRPVKNVVRLTAQGRT